MGDLSEYTRNGVVNYLFRGVPLPPPPTNIFVALFTADPTPYADLAHEVSPVAWPGYARIDSGVLADAWKPPVLGATENLQRMFFSINAGAQTVSVSHAALFDAAVGGNMISSCALAKIKDVDPGDDLNFQPGTLSFQLT